MLRLDINILWTIINILIIYVIVRRFLFKPVKKILAARQAEIDQQYADAQAAQDTAVSMKQQYEETLTGIADEKGKMLSEARGRASDEYERIIAQARTEAEKIRSDARRTADLEQEKYMQQAREQIAELVVAAASKVVASRQSAETDRELYNEFLAKTGEKCD